jgi:putative NADH-flavin reductase
MKIVIFGASGGTGQELVTQALAAGHEVSAFVRSPGSLPPRDGLRVIQGDALDRDAVVAAIAGQDAVLSALGARTLGKSDLLERAITYILEGMHAHGVRRLIVLGAAGALHDANRRQTLGRRIFFRIFASTMLRYPMADSAAQERRIESSDVEYTVVHPPRLLDTPRTGQYRVETDGLPPGGFQISRGDVAEFMLKQLTDRTYVRGGPYLAC